MPLTCRKCSPRSSRIRTSADIFCDFSRRRLRRFHEGRIVAMRRALIFICLLTAGCGRVGDPLPPFIRIPESVADLAVYQSGHNLVLTWTNPQRYVDGSAATDLSAVVIISNGSV